MKLEVTRKEERGHAQHGWLTANHYFSFGGYYNSEKMGFGKLKVINDDQIAPSMGFATHSHENMEIITIPLKGAVKHKDSEGNSGIITSGEVQIMSAGTGISHSEHNSSHTENLELFQIWIEPSRLGFTPRYEQKNFQDLFIKNELLEIVSSTDSKSKDSLKINQDAKIMMGEYSKDFSFKYELKSTDSGLYGLVVEGGFVIEGETLNARDSISLKEVKSVSITATSASKIILIEVPM